MSVVELRVSVLQEIIVGIPACLDQCPEVAHDQEITVAECVSAVACVSTGFKECG